MANTVPRGDSNHQLEGMFKKVRPARPQPFWRAKRTWSTWARQNGENAAGGFFQHPLKVKQNAGQTISLYLLRSYL